MPMADLRLILEQSGLKNVQTYIQSGNVVFQSEETAPELLRGRIAASIQNHFGYPVPVLVIKALEYSEIVTNNPFSADHDESLLHITFLAEYPEKHLIEPMSDFLDLPNKFVIFKKAVYLFCPDGYSKTKISNSFLERKLKVLATTRNLKTSLILQQMI